MRVRPVLAALMLAATITVPAAFAGDKAKSETLTGVVSDAMCGAKHMMEGGAAACTRECVNKGSKYALVVGDKVYTLDAGDQASKDALNKLAGEKAKVTGTVKGGSIEVSAVSAGN
jgi:hypothetical protein